LKHCSCYNDTRGITTVKLNGSRQGRGLNLMTLIIRVKNPKRINPLYLAHKHEKE
jgi:hypothetical protein